MATHEPHYLGSDAARAWEYVDDDFSLVYRSYKLQGYRQQLLRLMNSSRLTRTALSEGFISLFHLVLRLKSSRPAKLSIPNVLYKIFHT